MFSVGTIVTYKGKTKRIAGIRRSPENTLYHLGNGLWVRDNAIRVSPNAHYRPPEKLVKASRSAASVSNNRAKDRVALRGLTSKAMANILGEVA